MAQQATERLLAGRYRLVERLGSGGMAAVWLAEDEHLGRRVALKRLHGDSPEDMARRFEREAKLLARLNHQNVVGIFDTVADDEGIVIVMEHVPGGTLRDALQDGPLPERRVAEIVTGVAAALDHGHAQGIVHRDVKPANVLLREDGIVKLADFGIATAAERTQITRTGTVLGTAAYMAPEQLQGGEATPASDVYALGAVAFEALTGRRAVPGKTPAEIVHRVANGPPSDLRALRPDLPARVAETIERAMARDPRDRPPSACDLARDLAAALTGGLATGPTARLAGGPATGPTAPLAATSPPISHERRAPAATRPRRSWIGWTALLLVAGVLALAFALAEGGGEERAGGDAAAPSEERSQGSSRESDARPQGDDEAPAEEPAGDPIAEGLALEDEGFAAMQAGRYDEAIAASGRAVELLEGSGRIEYAYALFNLGRSLRLAGRPEEAIPVLERRLEIPDQTGTVRAELELARREAAGPAGGGDGEGQGKKSKKDERGDD